MSAWTTDEYGRMVLAPDTTGMGSPVRCLCGGVYDLQAVHVTARYADCSVWKAPCCGRQADDREWKSLPDFRRLPRSNTPREEEG